jgi:hypothetical protein
MNSLWAMMDDVPEFFRDVLLTGSDISLDDLLKRLSLALVLGCVVGLVYRFTQRGDSPASPSFVATLVLLCVIIAMVTMVVGDKVGRAFTLVGALSIVRFRTVVEDTRDTAFVIFAVVVGMGAGLNNREVAIVGLAVVSAAAIALYWVQRYTFKPQAEWTLQLRVSTGAGSESPWETLFAKHCDSAQLQSTATARQGAAVDLTYKLRLKPGVTPLQLLNDVNRLEGIQNLELKRI